MNLVILSESFRKWYEGKNVNLFYSSISDDLVLLVLRKKQTAEFYDEEILWTFYWYPEIFNSFYEIENNVLSLLDIWRKYILMQHYTG